MKRTMVIEPVSRFNGIDVLVARDEGFFAAEGLDVQLASRQHSKLRSYAEGPLEHPVTNQGCVLDRREAHMFQSCACGNNRLVAESRIGARQVG